MLRDGALDFLRSNSWNFLRINISTTHSHQVGSMVYMSNVCANQTSWSWWRCIRANELSERDLRENLSASLIVVDIS